MTGSCRSIHGHARTARSTAVSSAAKQYAPVSRIGWVLRHADCGMQSSMRCGVPTCISGFSLRLTSIMICVSFLLVCNVVYNAVLLSRGRLFWTCLKGRGLLFSVALVLCLSMLPHHLAEVVRLSSVLGQSADLFSFEVEEAASQYRSRNSMKETHSGRGAHARARKAMRVHAQLTPRFLNMGETKRGKPTPKRDRRTELAARTEAA